MIANHTIADLAALHLMALFRDEPFADDQRKIWREALELHVRYRTTHTKIAVDWMYRHVVRDMIPRRVA